MFRRYKFGLGGKIEANGILNNLSIAFRSPIEYAKQQFDLQAQDYVVPPVCAYPEGVCHANHIRKMQSSFG